MASRRPGGCALSPSQAAEKVEEQIYAETEGLTASNGEHSASKQLHEQSETETKIETEIIDLTGDLTITVFPPEIPPAYAPKTAATLPRRFRVSSRILAQKSKYFAAMLTGRWSEGRKFHANGTVDLEILDTDPDTFSTLMRILHSLPPARSTTETLDQLTKLTVQADYFQCEEILRLPSLPTFPSMRLWFQRTFDTSILSADARWVFLAWMYDDADRLHIATCVDQQQRTRNFDSLGLPIPKAIQTAIDDGRKRVISTIRDTIVRRFIRFRNEKPGCHGCDSLDLRFLTCELKGVGIDRSYSNPDYLCEDFSFNELHHKLRVIDGHMCICRYVEGSFIDQVRRCNAFRPLAGNENLDFCDVIPKGLRLQDFARP